MPWCSKCKVEYREGFTVCSDCGSVLVNAGEAEEKDRALLGDDRKVKQTEPQDEYAEVLNEPSEVLNEPVLLMQVANETEANNIIAMLAGEGIPACLSHKGLGQYLSITVGMSNLGVNIYVPKSALQQAKEIVASAKEEYSGDSSDGIADDIADGIADETKDDRKTDYAEDHEDNWEGKYKEGEIPKNITRVRFARILLISFFLVPLAYTLLTYLIRAIQSFLR